ncbi:HP1 family phage holin [Paraferrimonas sedimenticola]|nr:HP1 family phage holin [Paraferrimonas sedimenticola]
MTEHLSTSKTLAALSYSASAGTITGGVFSVHDFAVYCGIVLGVLTFVVNFIYQVLKDRRHKREHLLTMEIKERELKQAASDGQS